MERRKPRTFHALLAAFGVFVVGIITLAALQVPSALVGFGVPIIAAIIVFFVVR